MPSKPRRPTKYKPVASLTDHPLYAPIRECTACGLHNWCEGPVPGVGPEHARVMVILEAPGENEDVYGIPVTGATWEEMREYLKLADLTRDNIYLTNTVKCKPLGDPSLTDADPCGFLWLPQEIASVQPYLIVTAGQLATRFLLNDPSLTMEECHGIPRWSDQYQAWVLPIYHPSAGFYNTRIMRFLQDDFRTIGRAKLGVTPQQQAVLDSEAGVERYEYLTTENCKEVLFEAWSHEVIAVDTETTPDGELWCLSFSFQAGEAWVVKGELIKELEPLFSDPNITLVFHNSFYDVPKLRKAGLSITPGRMYDTMVTARELQLESGGLKELSIRRLGMKMRSYKEVMGDAQKALSLEYIQQAAMVASDPAYPTPASEWKLDWDKKVGHLVSKCYQPQPLGKKLARLLGDLANGKEVDVLERWKKYSLAETAGVREQLGSFPIAYLAHVNEELAVWYAARDADATRRLFDDLWDAMAAEGMIPVLEMDSKSLVMLLDMQSNGLKLDVPYLSELAVEYQWRQSALEAKLWDYAGYPWNPGSTDQTAQVVFKDLGLKSGRSTKTGKLSTDDEVLKPLAIHPKHGEFIKLLLEWRGLEKIRGTYVEPWLELADDEGKIYSDLSGMTETGRVAAKDPNVMAVPKRSDEGKRLRMGIVAG